MTELILAPKLMTSCIPLYLVLTTHKPLQVGVSQNVTVVTLFETPLTFPKFLYNVLSDFPVQCVVEYSGSK